MTNSTDGESTVNAESTTTATARRFTLAQAFGVMALAALGFALFRQAEPIAACAFVLVTACGGGLCVALTGRVRTALLGACLGAFAVGFADGLAYWTPLAVLLGSIAGAGLTVFIWRAERKLSVDRRFSVVLLSVPWWVVAFIATDEYRHITPSECSRCRRQRELDEWFTKRRMLTWPSSMTEWYREAHPEHQCFWCYTAPIAKCSFLETVKEAASAQHPLGKLTPEDQQKFLQSAPEDMQRRFFKLIESPNGLQQQTGVNLASEFLQSRRSP